MSKSIFIGGLSYKTTEEELSALFGTCGTVINVRILVDRATARSRGIGFVEMSTDAEARAAIEKISGTNLGGRKIFASESKPQDKLPGNLGFVERRSGKDRRRARTAPRVDTRKVDKHIRKWSSKSERSGGKKPPASPPKDWVRKSGDPGPKRRERKAGGSGPKKWSR